MRRTGLRRLPDRIFAGALFLSSVLVVAGVFVLLFTLAQRAAPALAHYGFGFIFAKHWNPVRLQFGALGFLYGTAESSAIGLVLAAAAGVAGATLLSYYVAPWIAGPLGFAVDLLAAVPSVVYGLWGVFVLAPWLQRTGEPALRRLLGFLPQFQGPAYGVGMLAAGLILAMMILPTIVAVVREVLRVVPKELEEGALAIGATKEEMIALAVFPYARQGVLGAVMLGLGRALGETMAVTMVIGNRPEISASLFAPGYSLAAVIANEFTEATSPLYVSALYEIGLILVILTGVFYASARILIWRVAHRVRVLP